MAGKQRPGPMSIEQPDGPPAVAQDWLSRFERVEMWAFLIAFAGFVGFGFLAAAIQKTAWAPLAIFFGAGAVLSWLLIGLSMVLMSAADMRRYVRKRRAKKFTPARVLYDNLKIGLSVVTFAAFLISIVREHSSPQVPKPQVFRTPTDGAIATAVSIALASGFALASWWICLNAERVTQWFSCSVTPAKVRARRVRWAFLGTVWSLLLLVLLLDVSGWFR